MIELDLDRIAKRRTDILTDLGTNALAKAALALGMVDRDVPALVTEIVRLNNELIDAQGDASPAVIWDEGYDAGMDDEAFDSRGLSTDPGRDHPRRRRCRHRLRHA